jgi:hypothetical protein
MARHNKQTSVKNRRMNPPRPASSNHGTAYPEPVGKSELRANFHFALPAFAGSERFFLCGRAHARLKKLRKMEMHPGAARQPATAHLPPVESASMASSRRHAFSNGRLTKNALKTPRKSVSVRSGNRQQTMRNDSRLQFPLLLFLWTPPVSDGEQEARTARQLFRSSAALGRDVDPALNKFGCPRSRFGNLGKLWISTKRKILCNYHRFLPGFPVFHSCFFCDLDGWVNNERQNGFDWDSPSV